MMILLMFMMLLIVVVVDDDTVDVYDVAAVVEADRTSTPPVQCC